MRILTESKITISEHNLIVEGCLGLSYDLCLTDNMNDCHEST